MVEMISIHAPLAGCDKSTGSTSTDPIFQSTHPLRGATDTEKYDKKQNKNFNPRTPCGVRRCASMLYIVDDDISIHAPLAGCDDDILEVYFGKRDFNPRTPCGVRPRHSISSGLKRHFNPRTPCGVRLPTISSSAADSKFQSTHPLRGATSCIASSCVMLPFQSTHPLRGATPIRTNTT